ncbi:hypothetical protein [Streptomyces sp. NPDC047981]|uniref:hypothetical protein n=1 Tax=Streptomyces sp. NPDC047981 TaxID=3154610 RepID=UPI0034462951
MVHGRWIRDAILTWGDDLGLQLKPGSQAANRFDIVGGEGGLLAAGLVGGLTGRGAHIAIVDPPPRPAGGFHVSGGDTEPCLTNDSIASSPTASAKTASGSR